MITHVVEWQGPPEECQGGCGAAGTHKLVDDTGDYVDGPYCKYHADYAKYYQRDTPSEEEIENNDAQL